MKKTIFYWIIAIIITLTAAVYQRLTGPTHPKRSTLEYKGETYKIRLLRNHESTSDCPLILKVDNDELSAVLEYKKFPSNEDWTLLLEVHFR